MNHECNPAKKSAENLKTFDLQKIIFRNIWRIWRPNAIVHGSAEAAPLRDVKIIE
jgi:hypothetical protein